MEKIMFDQTCTNCGGTFSRKANFCPHCGTAAVRGSVDCRYCGKEMSAAARFCPHCGKSSEGSERPAVVSNTWTRDPEDFATRLEVDDLEGILQRDLIIEPGTRAIILVDGRNLAGTVGPGRYTLKTFGDRLSLPSLRRRVIALLVDTGEVDLALMVNDVYTSDPIKLSLECRLAVEVADPMAFFTNLLKGGRSYTLNQLRSYLYDEIQDAAQECVGQRSAADLHTNLAHKQEFATHIEAHLDETLRQTGLRFSRVRTMDFRHTRWDELTQEEEEFFLQLTRDEANLSHRKRLFDVFDQTELQAIAEETKKIGHFEQRAQLRERMRRAVLSDKFAELTSEQEMEQFLRDMDRQKLIADDEWDRIKRTIQWQREGELQDHRWQVEDAEWDRLVAVDDRERTQAHLLARLELENEYELKQIRFLQDSELSEAELKFQLDQERTRVERMQEIEAAKIAFDLKQRREQAEFRREQDVLDREASLAAARDELGLDAERFDEETRQILADLDVAAKGFDVILAKREKEMGLHWEDDRQRLDHQLSMKEREIEMDLQQREVEHRMVLEREAQAQEFELARMERLKDLPPEAVVAVADAERGRIIADMQRTEAMKGMTEQQILAMAAQNQPEAAQALAEIAKAAAEGRMGQEQVELYERLLRESEQASTRVEQAWRTTADKIQETAHKALDSQREGMVEIARATSHPPSEGQPPTVVVTGPGGTPTVVGGPLGAGASGDVILCRRCGTRSPVGTRFCTNCGYEFFPTGGEEG